MTRAAESQLAQVVLALAASALAIVSFLRESVHGLAGVALGAGIATIVGYGIALAQGLLQLAGL